MNLERIDALEILRSVLLFLIVILILIGIFNLREKEVGIIFENPIEINPIGQKEENQGEGIGSPVFQGNEVGITLEKPIEINPIRSEEEGRIQEREVSEDTVPVQIVTEGEGE